LFDDIAGCQRDMRTDKYTLSMPPDVLAKRESPSRSDSRKLLSRVKSPVHQADIEDMRKYVLVLITLLAACKSMPPEKMPVSTLEFDRIEGRGIHQLVLYYRFKTENPRFVTMSLKIPDWHVAMNGKKIERKNAVIKNNGAVISSTPMAVAAKKSFETELELHLDLSAYCNANNASVKDGNGSGWPDNGDTFITELILEASCQYGAARPIVNRVPAVAEFPRIREPEFSITSIAIMQAELINTRFAVTLRIDNPNPFPVTLSSFKYDLYGHGMFWADGSGREILAIPANDAAETKLSLVMNFINMKRSLLDEIIAMRHVGYRFTGATEIETGIAWLPHFSMEFDRHGYSEVRR